MMASTTTNKRAAPPTSASDDAFGGVGEPAQKRARLAVADAFAEDGVAEDARRVLMRVLEDETGAMPTALFQARGLGEFGRIRWSRMLESPRFVAAVARFARYFCWRHETPVERAPLATCVAALLYGQATCWDSGATDVAIDGEATSVLLYAVVNRQVNCGVASRELFELHYYVAVVDGVRRPGAAMRRLFSVLLNRLQTAGVVDSTVVDSFVLYFDFFRACPYVPETCRRLGFDEPEVVVARVPRPLAFHTMPHACYANVAERYPADPVS